MEQSMQSKLSQLRAPLPSKDISWRVGRIKDDKTKGQALPYIKPRVIHDLLDSIVGPENWRNSFVSCPMGQHASLVSVIEIFVNGHWVHKSDGAHIESFSDESNNREIAIKGAYSDAFRRASVMWGIGRYLYDFPIAWVDLNEHGFLASRPKLPANLVPEDERGAVKATTTSKAATASEPEVALKPAAPEKEQPTEKQATQAVAKKAAPLVENKAEVPAEATVEKSVPAVAPQAAPVAAAVTSTVAEDEEAARKRAGALVDAEMAFRATALISSAAPAKEASGDYPPGMPEGLNDEQLKTVRGLIEKIKKKLPTAMLRNYVRGPKAAESLPESARNFVLGLLDEADGKSSQA